METWIRAAKFSYKIPFHSEDMDQMLTEFPQKGIFLQS